MNQDLAASAVERRRPPASVIVPFRGSDAELRSLRERLERLVCDPGDEIIVADNRDDPIKTPAYARNRGAARATGEWLVFIDADATPEPELLEAYFDPPPGEEVAILAGSIRDAAAADAGLIARYAVAREQLSHAQTLERKGRPYAQTANCAIRGSAFAAVGGFDPTARAGEDADLCFRLVEAGWGLEMRPAAAVAHRPRATLRAWLTQLAVHGSGVAWLERRWPGEFVRPDFGALARRSARHATETGQALAHGDVEQAWFAALDLMGALAFSLGRRLPNRRPLVWRTPRRGRQADRMSR